MHALLEPLRGCLARVESSLQELSRTSPPSWDHFGDGLSAYPTQDQTLVVTEAHFNGKPESPVVTESYFQSNPESRESVDEGTTNNARGGSPISDVLSREADEEVNEEVAERLEVDRVLQMEGLADEVSMADRMALRLKSSARWWAGLSEPHKSNCVYRIVKAPAFENTCILIILFNSALVALRADWEVQHIGEREPVSFEVLETVCFAWFVVELIVRMLAHRQHFFFNADMFWNLFDLTLVSISLVDFVFSIIAEAQDDNNVGFMRVLRLLKMAKIFRSLRSFRFFKSLEMLLMSFQRSLVSLFWGLIMLAFVLYLFTLIFLQGCSEYLSSGSEDPIVADAAKFYFGSFGKTFLSLYMAVTGGDSWINLYRVMAAAGWVYGLVLAFFTFFFLFAIFNILTGTLVEKAMTTSKPDRTELILHQRKKNAEEKKQFLRLCMALDHDHDGAISLAEFKEWMDNDVMLCYMQSIGIEIHDVELFFGTVAAREGRSGQTLKEGEVTIEHFVEGCMNMRGTATSLDMQRQLFEMHVLHHDLQHIENSFTDRLRSLEQLISQCCSINSSNSERRLVEGTSAQI